MKQTQTTHLGMGFALNFIFTVIELIGGFLTNSVTIYACALHDFGDSLSLGLSYGLEHYAEKRKSGAPVGSSPAAHTHATAHASSAAHTPGHDAATPAPANGRLAEVAELINSIILIIGAVILLSEAIPRLSNPAYVSAKGMAFLALLGFLTNGIAVLRMKVSAHPSFKIVRAHLVEDVMVWTAVLIVSLILLVAQINFLDPLMSIFITIWVLRNVAGALHRVITTLLHGSPAV
jgi:cobalt-zinc-cadmium efflux system protein